MNEFNIHRILFAIMVCVTVFFGTLSAQGNRVTLSGNVMDTANGESMMGVYVIMTDLNNAFFPASCFFIGICYNNDRLKRDKNAQILC